MIVVPLLNLNMENADNPDKPETEVSGHGQVVESCRILDLVSKHVLSWLSRPEESPVHVVVPHEAI